MEASHTVVRFDYPGHGEESDVRDIGTVEDMSASLHAELAAAGITKFHFCGVSLGGALGIALAAHFPESVESLVISNSGATLGNRAFWEARMGIVESGGVGAIADATVGRWLSENRSSGPAASWLRDMFVTTSKTGYMACAAAVMDFDGTSLLGRISARTLVISGTLDAATPAALGQELARRISGAIYVEIPCAHIAPVDAPAEFRVAVEHFRCDRRSSGSEAGLER